MRIVSADSPQKLFYAGKNQHMIHTLSRKGSRLQREMFFVGYDVWRLLDYMDYPSYGYEIYSAFDFSKKFDIIEDHIAIREHPRPVKNKARQRPVQKHVNWHAYL